MKPRRPRRRTAALKLRLKALRKNKSRQQPCHTYSILQQQLKGEDVLFVISDLSSIAPDRTDLGQWSVYAVCDGHGGTGAAKFVRKYLGRALARVLPGGHPPSLSSDKCEAFCRLVRHALVKAFVSLHDLFESEGCRISGTTVSVCLVCDWLLTTANVADSEVFLDLGHSIMEMTNCHKVDTNTQEVKRLREGGADLRRLASNGSGPAPAGQVGRGPLRVWPGGIAMSRSIGDLDCDEFIVPVPHIRQIWIPKEGSRLLMASDGLWDYMSGGRACRLIHRLPVTEAPQKLLKAAEDSCRGVLGDDISILVVDIMPQEGINFSERKATAHTGVLRSFKGYLHHPSFHSKLRKAKKSVLFADKDGLKEFPNMEDNLVPEICDTYPARLDSEDESHSRNSSMNSENWDVCECSWDCGEESSLSWEKDDRDILDTAQSYVVDSSSQNHCSQSVKVVMKQPKQKDVDRLDSLRDFLDTSMASTDRPPMTTIYEPDEEEGMSP